MSSSGAPKDEQGGARGRLKVTAGVASILAALLTGYAALDALDAVPGVLTVVPTSGGTPPPSLSGTAPRALDISGLDTRAPVPKKIAPVVDKAFKDSGFKGKIGTDIRDAATGEVLYAKGENTGRTPASVTKVLTSAAALGALGADHTFTTAARLDSAEDGSGSLALVGGGDVMLGKGESKPGAVNGRAGLGTLAENTARELKHRGVEKVEVYADVSRYTGPRFSKDWDRSDIELGFITNLDPLMVHMGSKTGELKAPRTPEPARDALRDFADALTKNGIEVSVRNPDAQTDPPQEEAAPLHPEDAEGDGAEQQDQTPAVLAEVQSAPVSSLVRHALQHSDNIVSEVLGREVALARGAEASESSAPAEVLRQLGDMDIDTGDIRLFDTSGLSYKNRISPHDLTGVIVAAAQSDDSLSQLIPGMPVGGLNGTLIHRYGEGGAAGSVSAKTGTLATVASLSGTVVTADGRLLAFSMMTEGAVGGAREAIDAAVTGLAKCGCR
ncbi:MULTISPECIES: D-alanyl-D-alanine carboxypeptidase/D-alanyl-D-alanine-endopeptidase [unclassified Brevibacterium]|uniref:D-alanyl-D-alanine carboxypeptidase/D-alanyl-D-alanine endopeptidase n=1 Tax=unclassified Brevibacterium TaxID=2614124 RepID=UPI0008A2F384|nr:MULTISPECIES: D-alanyl-D-alanine carboxypeptidase/D-alanyl-D-alanine-endopeptidase [unclassified Brevibacterium]OFS27793.1 hypothetical protein HMPREF3162_00935 [Brevibacterium sp. HMSC07C04]